MISLFSPLVTGLSLFRELTQLFLPSFFSSQGFDKAPVSYLTANKVYYANTPESVAEPTAAHTVRSGLPLFPPLPRARLASRC